MCVMGEREQHFDMAGPNWLLVFLESQLAPSGPKHTTVSYPEKNGVGYGLRKHIRTLLVEYVITPATEAVFDHLHFALSTVTHALGTTANRADTGTRSRAGGAAGNRTD